MRPRRPSRTAGELREAYLERLRTEASQLAAGRLRLAFEAEQEPEFPDIAEAELVPRRRRTG